MKRWVTGVVRALGWLGMGLPAAWAVDAAKPPPGRWLLLDRGLGLGEGRHVLSLTQQPGARVVAEVLPPREGIPRTAALFEVSAHGRASLRRLPALGREEDSEPLCRVLAEPGLGQDAGATGCVPDVAGAWRVVSRGSDGSVYRLGWEWWSDGRELAGRFDPASDFRFAHFLRGTNGGGHVAFTVEYIQDRYDVRGDATATGWAGSWTKRGQADAGSWTAERADLHGRVAGREDAVGSEPLRAWQRSGDEACWVGLGGDWPEGEGWGTPAILGAAWRHGGARNGGSRQGIKP